MPEDTDITEEQLTIEDILGDSEDAKYHTILEIWRSLLTSAENVRAEKISPQWANRVTSSYRELNYADMPEFRDRYFDKIIQMRMILDIEIASDDECLNLFTAEEDAEINAYHYVNILIEWQKSFLMWEMEWDCTAPWAPVELAAISEVHKLFFDTTGITSGLDAIQFEFSEASRDLLATTLQELKEAQEGQ